MKKLFYAVCTLLVSSPAFAQMTREAGFFPTEKSVLIFAGVFGVALAAFGGTMSQSKAAAVALEGVARNPAASDKLFTPMLLALALMESLVIFTLVSIFLVK